jgi:hypothetical protein
MAPEEFDRAFRRSIVVLSPIAILVAFAGICLSWQLLTAPNRMIVEIAR